MQQRLRSGIVLCSLLLILASGGVAGADEPAFADTPAASTPKAAAADPDEPVHLRLGSSVTMSFGTYGRVQMSSNLKGGAGRDIDVVSHGARLEETPYLELHWYTVWKTSAATFRAVISPALMGLENLFHYSGDPDVTLAVRNLFVEVEDIYRTGAFFWVGSRMYRGDDIYLLDYWPMDNLNTYGAGVGWRSSTMEAAAHVGVNRLNNDYQYQEVEIPGRTYGSETIVTLDRQRTILSLGFTHKFPDLAGELGLKYKVYGEFHHLPSGDYRLDDRSTQQLPRELGWVLGLEVGAWGFGRNSFVNLFFRYAGDLGAYHELAVPYGLNLDRATDGAEQLLFGFSGNYEYKWFGVLFGGYVQRFLDALPEEYDPYDFAEFILVARPMVFIGEHFRIGSELSLQRRQAPGQEESIGTGVTPLIFKWSLIPSFALGKGALARPEVRLIYTLAYLNEGARYVYPQGDDRRDMRLQHFIGFGVEWWYNAYGY